METSSKKRPFYILVASLLLVVGIGTDLYLWYRASHKALPKSYDKQYQATQQTEASIDTAADIKIIREFYEVSGQDPIPDTIDWMAFRKRHLTQTLIDYIELIGTHCDYDAMTRSQDTPTSFLKTLRVRALKGDWYMVSYYADYEKEWMRIPVRMVTDRDGKRKIGFVTDASQGEKATDSIFYPQVLRMGKVHRNAQSFLQDFYRSYMSTYLTPDLNAPAYRKWLVNHYVAKALRTDGGDGVLYLLCELFSTAVSDKHWQPHYQLKPAKQTGWYEASDGTDADYGRHYVKVEKAGNDYLITDMKSLEEDDEPEDREECFEIVEQMPEFPGGLRKLLEYLGSHTTYPESAQKQGLEGRVIISFVVEKDGSIADAKVERSAAPDLNTEALRVVRAMPLWKPGMHHGDPVRVKFRVPITFRLSE